MAELRIETPDTEQMRQMKKEIDRRLMLRFEALRPDQQHDLFGVFSILLEEAVEMAVGEVLKWQSRDAK